MRKYEWQPTRENPGRWSWLLDDIAELENTSPNKTITFTSLEKARNEKYKLTSMIFNIDGKDCLCLGSTTRIGSIKILLFSGFEIPFDSYNGEIKVEVRKTLKEYTTEPKYVGNYKVCDGGGWYSNASLYELNGIYYTNGY